MREIASHLKPDGSTWNIQSAGINAIEDSPPSRLSQAVLAERGIDISNHRAKTTSQELLNDHQLILCMEKLHRQILSTRFPADTGRIRQLSDMVGQDFSVEDPFGLTLEDYRKTSGVIERLLQEGLPKIAELSRETNGG